jgi:hypothetical protein
MFKEFLINSCHDIWGNFPNALFTSDVTNVYKFTQIFNLADLNSFHGLEKIFQTA